MAFNLENMKDYAYPLVGAIYEVHSELGPGLNEYVYQEGLAMQLEEEGIPFEREKELTIKYHGKLMNATYRMDFLCAGTIVIECKSVEKLALTGKIPFLSLPWLSPNSCLYHSPNITSAGS